MYDWANSAFATVILTAVFPVYYRTLAASAGHGDADATAYWAYTTSFSLLLVALLGPVLGAMAILLYYWFAAPGLADAYGAGEAGVAFVRAAAIALVTLWLARQGTTTRGIPTS